MRNKRLIFLRALLVAVAGVLTWLLLRKPSEPFYQGRPLSYWLKGMEGWQDTNDAAFVAFSHMEANVIPRLLTDLQFGNGPLERMIQKINRKQSFIKIPYGESLGRNMAATWALYAMGSNARPALPVLTNMLFHSDDVISSAVVLAGIGPEALPILLSTLTNQNDRIRHAGVMGLALERSNFNLVVPALIGSLQDTNQGIREGAAISLGALHAGPDMAVPALMKSFPGNNTLLRRLILQALGEFGDKARPAIPMIVSALNDSNADVSSSACSALKQIDPLAAAKAGVK